MPYLLLCIYKCLCYSDGRINDLFFFIGETPTPIPTSTPTSTPVSSKCDNKTKEDCCNEDTCVYAQCEGQSDGGIVGI